MAYRRKTKFRKYKKPAGRRGVKRRKASGIGARKRRRTSGSYSGGRKYGGGGFGVLSKRRWVKLKYINCAEFDPRPLMTGLLQKSGNDHIYRTNNVYDPQYASTGGSNFNQKCAGYAFWAKLYDHYEVIKSRIKITYRQSTIGTYTAMEPLICGLRVDDDASLSTYTGYEQFLGDPNTKFRTMRFTTDPGSSKPVTMTMWWRKKYGGNPANNVAAVGAGPADEEYFVPWYQTAAKGAYNLANGIPRMSYQVSITYWVRFSEPHDLGATSDMVQA